MDNILSVIKQLAPFVPHYASPACCHDWYPRCFVAYTPPIHRTLSCLVSYLSIMKELSQLQLLMTGESVILRNMKHAWSGQPSTIVCPTTLTTRLVSQKSTTLARYLRSYATDGEQITQHPPLLSFCAHCQTTHSSHAKPRDRCKAPLAPISQHMVPSNASNLCKKVHWKVSQKPLPVTNPYFSP